MEIRPQPRRSLAEGRRSSSSGALPGTTSRSFQARRTHEPGNVRVSFLVADAQGQAVTLPTARVWVANALDARPFLETTAKLERIGVPGGAEADATHIYVANVKLPHAGKYWLLAEPEGGKDKVQALGNVVVSKNDAPRRTSGIPLLRPTRRHSRRPAATSRS